MLPHLSPKHSGALTTVAAVVMVARGLLSAASAGVAPPQIPALSWKERSDWINVKTDIAPTAVGDGQADDTLALQQALSGLRDGSVLYFPQGVYRITAPLSLRNATGARWLSGLIVGHGHNTKLVWDGEAGGTMVLLNGIAYSRFVGFELDGRSQAGVGFHYQATQGFQTEVTHRHLAFRGFTNAAILENHPNQGQALAETTFENCLFENCERGVAFLQFNDYDYTFDGCEFSRCGVAIDCDHGNFYVRNCHFEASRVVDIRDGSEHCSSIRRTTSIGSRAFVQRRSSRFKIAMWKTGLLSILTSAALAFGLFAAAPDPAQFFIAPNGHDEDPGTKEKPCATPTRAMAAVRAVVCKIWPVSRALATASDERQLAPPRPWIGLATAT